MPRREISAPREWPQAERRQDGALAYIMMDIVCKRGRAWAQNSHSPLWWTITVSTFPQRSIDKNLDSFSYPRLFVLSLHFHPFNMPNAIVNGTGLENQFGQCPVFRILTSTRYSPADNLRPPASLGIDGTKSAYVPPHLRNAQRAASNPPPPTNGYVVLHHCYVSPFC